MKNEIYDKMLSRYDLTTEQNKRNAIFEESLRNAYLQQILIK